MYLPHPTADLSPCFGLNHKDCYPTPEALEDDIRGYFKAEQSESLLTTVETVLRERNLTPIRFTHVIDDAY